MMNVIIETNKAKSGSGASLSMAGCMPLTDKRAEAMRGADDARLADVAPSAPPITSSCAEASRILRLPEVIRRVGLCRASIYQHMNQGSFPKTISLGLRAVGWLESEVDAWIQLRIAGRRP